MPVLPEPSEDVRWLFCRTLRQQLTLRGINSEVYNDDEVWKAVVVLCKRGKEMLDNFSNYHTEQRERTAIMKVGYTPVTIAQKFADRDHLTEGLLPRMKR